MKRGMILNKLQPVFRQYGVSMIELLGAVAVGSVVMAGVAQQANTYIDNTKDAYTAEHARMYAEAARAYIKENFKGENAIIPATGTSVTASQLDQYLPAGFSVVRNNPYGQEPVLVVRKESVPGNLANGVRASSAVKGFLVYTSGTQIPNGRRQFVAAMAGLGGGYVDSAGNPKGSGWDASSIYSTSYARLARAKAGRVVVSMNVFDPADVVDYRYLCRSQDALNQQPECNKLQGVDLDVGNNAVTNVMNITNTSSTALKINAPQISISHPVTNQPTRVVIGGDLTATVLRAIATKQVDEICSKGDLGALARAAKGGEESKSGSDAGDFGTGTILSCKLALDKSSNNDPVYQWRPLFSSQEEVSSIIGCDVRNNFCQADPNLGNCSELNSGVPLSSDDYARELCEKRRSIGLIREQSTIRSGQYTWTANLGKSKRIGNIDVLLKPLFCAVGFHGQTGPSDGSTPGSGPANTFCRVWPDSVSKQWKIRVGSQYNIPIACHAVCLYE